MANIEGIRIRNFRALRDVTLGRLWNQKELAPLSPMTAVIGRNGAGKSSLFDAFGFLADCLKSGVEEACDSRGRGGFERIRSKQQAGPIEFEIYYKQEKGARPITYELAIDVDRQHRPYVLRERLRQRRQGQKRGWPFSFLMLQKGAGAGVEGHNGSEGVRCRSGADGHSAATAICAGEPDGSRNSRDGENRAGRHPPTGHCNSWIAQAAPSNYGISAVH